VTVNKLPVRIREGMTLTDIAVLLKSKGVIRDAHVFRVIMDDNSKEIQAGFYFFDGQLTLNDVKRIITSPPFAT
jgi:cell division protein YceG involved in septum cleavage